VLEKAGAPATIFVCTDLLDTTRIPWYCRLHDAVSRTTRHDLDWDGRRWDLGSVGARTRAATGLKSELKGLHHPELETAVDDIARRLGLDVGNGVSPDPRFRIMSRAAMREMARDGLVEFGAHTASHAILSKLTPAEQHDEIERSIAEVGEVTGEPCRLFAYPNGRFEDYDPTTLDILRAAGVAVAVTAEKGWNDASTPPLELLRYAIGGEPSMPGFEQTLKRFEKALRASS
jgi:peptidoglycan/xylan/chitin deacetylase (PgdA/CDA1 family)